MSRRLLHLFALRHRGRTCAFRTIHVTMDGGSGVTHVYDFEVVQSSCLFLNSITFPFEESEYGSDYIDAVVEVNSNEHWEMIFCYGHFRPRMELPQVMKDWIHRESRALEIVPIVGHDVTLVGLLIDLEKKSPNYSSLYTENPVDGNRTGVVRGGKTFLVSEKTPIHRFDSTATNGEMKANSYGAKCIKVNENAGNQDVLDPNHRSTQCTPSSLEKLHIDGFPFKSFASLTPFPGETGQSVSKHPSVSLDSDLHLEQSSVFSNSPISVNPNNLAGSVELTDSSWSEQVESILSTKHLAAAGNLNLNLLDSLKPNVDSTDSCVSQSTHPDELDSIADLFQVPYSSQLPGSCGPELDTCNVAPLSITELRKEKHLPILETHDSVLYSSLLTKSISSCESSSLLNDGSGPDLNLQRMPYAPDSAFTGNSDNAGLKITGEKDLQESSPLPQSNSYTESLHRMTLQDLAPYFRFRIEDAAKMLHVGVTVLKKCCRKFGIKRWPQRKINSLSNLIQSISTLTADPAVDGSPPQNTHLSSAINQLQEQQRRIAETPEIPLAKRVLILRQSCFKASYKKRKLQQQNGKMVQTS